MDFTGHPRYFFGMIYPCTSPMPSQALTVSNTPPR